MKPEDVFRDAIDQVLTSGRLMARLLASLQAYLPAALLCMFRGRRSRRGQLFRRPALAEPTDDAHALTLTRAAGLQRLRLES
jgi:hypothetical protein